ncbi:MAG TPA: type II secretion system secretin GspD [Rhizomicrobium sp.]|jgi:general secretion pathway protein D|nr:type II secretion system secretin GspD [Rhizomicrobium sp.]
MTMTMMTTAAAKAATTATMMMTMITNFRIRLAAYAIFSLSVAGVAVAQPQPLTQPPASQPADPSPPASQPATPSAVYPGTQQFTAGPRVPGGRSGQTNDVSLNFPNADVHEVAKAILGDILGVNYAVDPLVTGTVTVETARPVARSDVLPIFEEALRASKLALVRQGDVYTVVALEKAQRQPQLLPSTSPGYGNEAIPLHYVNATDLKKLLDPLLPEHAIAAADASRNMLLITGTAGERKSIRELVRQFDVDWMHGMSFALLVPQRTDMHVLLPELDAMVNSKDSPTAGLVRLIPIERLNGILAISSQPKYLTQLKKWVGILDRASGENERKLFVYHVQNGRASDLATVLVGAFGGTPNQPTQSTTPNLTATGQATPVNNYRPGFGSPTTPGSPTGTGQPGMGMGSGLGSPSGSSFGSGTGFQNGSTFGSNSGLANGSQLGENNTNGTQGTAIVSQTLMLPGQVTPISITSDDGNNSLVFYSTPRQYGLIQDALRQLDVLPLQVLIEAAITEVTLNDKLQYGVQWRFSGSGGTAALTRGTDAGLAQVFPGFSYFFATANGNIAAALNELSDITHIKVLSAPKVMVLNNHTAQLQVGDEVPVLQAQVTSTLTSDASITNEVNYVSTGVILNVTPRVNDSGLVLLDLQQQVSDVSSTTSSSINSPTIQQRMIQSSIAVKDGQTIALGGLIKDNTNQEKVGIPWLNDIPGVGLLFGSNNNEHDRTELLVLLTPRVVRNAEDVKTITDELREKIHSATPLPAATER